MTRGRIPVPSGPRTSGSFNAPAAKRVTLTGTSTAAHRRPLCRCTVVLVVVDVGDALAIRCVVITRRVAQRRQLAAKAPMTALVCWEAAAAACASASAAAVWRSTSWHEPTMPIIAPEGDGRRTDLVYEIFSRGVALDNRRSPCRHPPTGPGHRTASLSSARTRGVHRPGRQMRDPSGLARRLRRAEHKRQPKIHYVSSHRTGLSARATRTNYSAP